MFGAREFKLPQNVPLMALDEHLPVLASWVVVTP